MDTTNLAEVASSKTTRPPIVFNRSFTSVSPIPAASSRVLKCGSQICSTIPGGIPGPLSRTEWYPGDCDVRRVGTRGYIKYKGAPRYIGLALAGQSIGLRHTAEDEVQMLFYDMDLGLLRLVG